MGNATYQSDPAAWAKLAVSDDILAALEVVAQKGKGLAEAMAADFTVSGDYAASFNVRTDTVKLTTREGTHDVVAAILENTSDHALAVEFGNAHDGAAHHVLGRVRATLTGADAPSGNSRTVAKAKVTKRRRKSSPRLSSSTKAAERANGRWK